MIYIFKTQDDANRFVFEVLATRDIMNFNYRYNCVEIFDEISIELSEKIEQYGGKIKASN